MLFDIWNLHCYQGLNPRSDELQFFHLSNWIKESLPWWLLGLIMDTKEHSVWHIISLKYYKSNIPIIIIKIVILFQVSDEIQTTLALIAWNCESYSSFLFEIYYSQDCLLIAVKIPLPSRVYRNSRTQSTLRFGFPGLVCQLLSAQILFARFPLLTLLKDSSSKIGM